MSTTDPSREFARYQKTEDLLQEISRARGKTSYLRSSPASAAAWERGKIMRDDYTGFFWVLYRK